jgi:hypothetical protein
LRSLRAALRGPPPPLACWCRSRWPPSRCAVLESQWTSCGICSSSLLWWLSGWCCSTCWPAGAEPAVTAAAPPCVVARALGCRRRRRAQQSTKIADAPLHQSREAHHSARPAFAEAHASQHLATQPVPISATNHPSTRPRVPDGSHHGALLSTQFFRGEQCAGARPLLGGAGQLSSGSGGQGRGAGAVTAEPSWLAERPRCRDPARSGRLAGGRRSRGCPDTGQAGRCRVRLVRSAVGASVQPVERTSSVHASGVQASGASGCPDGQASGVRALSRCPRRAGPWSGSV